MKNLLQASKDIKKKLSFDDYRVIPIPADTSSQELIAEPQEELQIEEPLSVCEEQQPNVLSGALAEFATLPLAEIAEVVANKSRIEPVEDIALNAELASAPEACCLSSTGTNTIAPAQVIATEPTMQQAKESAKNQAKIKVTHYLTAQDHKALMRIYIKRLQNDIKVDKSALITEALHLLCEKEQI